MKWKEKKIEDIAVIYSGFAFKSSEMIDNAEANSIPVIKIKNVNNRVVSKQCDSYLPEGNFQDKYLKYTLLKDDILVAMTGQGSVGRIGKMRSIDGTYLINQRVGILRTKEELADSEFIYQQISNPISEKYYYDLAFGAGQPNLSPSDIGSLTISLPPLPTQRRIAAILSAYDDSIENNLKRIKLLEEKAFLRYKEIVRGERLEESILGDIATINGESLGKSTFLDSLLYIDISSVTQGVINSKTEYDLKEAPGRARRVVKHQDIIWSCVRPNRKSYAIIWEPEENLIVSTGFAVISSREVSPLFLYHCLSDDAFVQYLENNATGSAYPAVTSKDFEKAKIGLPSKDILEEYQKEIEPIFQLIHNLQKQNARLREARDILLPRLMSGELGV